MTRTERFLSGFASGYVHLVLATAAGLWLTPFFLGRLGQETFGLWLLGTQILGYLLLMDIGVVALVPRETAYATGGPQTAEPAAIRAVVERALSLALVQTPLVLAAGAAALLWLPGAWEPLRGPMVPVLGLFVVSFPLRVFPAVLTGLQDLAFVARVHLAAWAGGTLLTVGLVLRGHGLAALAAGWCLTHLAVSAASIVRVARVFPGALPRRSCFAASLRDREYFIRCAWVSMNQLTQVLLNGTDVVVIGALLGPAAVVPYACTAKLVSVLANQPQALLQSAAPALSELRTLEDRPRLFRVSAALAQATLAISGLIACVILAVNGGFVRWWVGPEQYGGALLTLLLVGALIVRHFNTTNIYALFCFAADRRLALTGLLDGLLTLAATFVFVKLLGVPGAPLAALVGVSLVSVPLNLAALSRETSTSPAALLRTLAPWLWRFVAVAACAAAGGVWLAGAGVTLLAAAALGVAAVYAAATLPTVLDSPAGAYLRPLLARVVARIPFARATRWGSLLTVSR